MLDFPVVLQYNVDKGKYVPLTDKFLNVIFCHFYSERTMAHLFNSWEGFIFLKKMFVVSLLASWRAMGTGGVSICALYAPYSLSSLWLSSTSSPPSLIFPSSLLSLSSSSSSHHHFVSSWQWPIPTQLHNLFDDVLRIGQWLTTSHHNLKTVVLGWTSSWPN